MEVGEQNNIILHTDTLFEILVQLEGRTVLSLCKINKAVNSLCRKPELWQTKLKLLGATPASLQGLTLIQLINLYVEVTSVGYVISTQMGNIDDFFLGMYTSGDEFISPYFAFSGYASLLSRDNSEEWLDMALGAQLLAVESTDPSTFYGYLEVDKVLRGRLSRNRIYQEYTYPAMIQQCHDKVVLTLDGEVSEVMEQERYIRTVGARSILLHDGDHGYIYCFDFHNRVVRVDDGSCGDEAILENILCVGQIRRDNRLETVFMSVEGDISYSADSLRSPLEEYYSDMELPLFPHHPSFVSGYVTANKALFVVVDINNNLYHCSVEEGVIGEWIGSIGNVKRVHITKTLNVVVITHDGALYYNFELFTNGVIDVNEHSIIVDSSFFPAASSQRLAPELAELYQLPPLVTPNNSGKVYQDDYESEDSDL